MNMNNIDSLKRFANLWQPLLVSGLFAVVLGVLVLVWPGMSIVVAAALFGVYLLVTGVAYVIFAFALHVSAGLRILFLLSGVASLILAVLAFRHFGEGYAVLLLAIWVAVGFMLRGVTTIGSAISDPRLSERGWMVFAGVIGLIAGIVVLAWPIDSIVVLALVAGIWLVVIGVFEIVSAFRVRKANMAVQPELRSR